MDHVHHTGPHENVPLVRPAAGAGNHHENEIPVWKSITSGCLCVCPRVTLLRPSKIEIHWAFKVFLNVLNVVLMPLYLLYHGLNIYVFPCVKETVLNCFFGILTKYTDFFTDVRFTDQDFPPTAASLGNIEVGTEVVQWKRLPDMFKADAKHSRLVLFDENIAATDVCQGALGDCWLLAAFATLCEQKTFIQNCFITPSKNTFGKYVIRLFDIGKNDFVLITVDDWIPCNRHTGQPLFTKFNGHEMWPLLLEKAYAKLQGSFAAIEGGIPLEGMKTLTGCGGKYVRDLSGENVFAELKKYHDSGCLLAAGSYGQDDTRIKGRDSVQSTIVGGHAYSILDIKTPHLTLKDIQLLKIRNPWGSFEWDGDWSDDSPLWKKHPGVALEIGRSVDKEDGIFYISWDDFKKLFRRVDVLFPSYGLDNLHYRPVEEDAYCGTCRGCFWGCSKFLCLCKGVRVLWWGHSSEELKHKVEGMEFKV